MTPRPLWLRGYTEIIALVLPLWRKLGAEFMAAASSSFEFHQRFMPLSWGLRETYIARPNLPATERGGFSSLRALHFPLL
jgi:hypothetical protein